MHGWLLAYRRGGWGVLKAGPLGMKFDPNMHEALFEMPGETVPNGTAGQVVEGGYAIDGRVLRPAKAGGLPRRAKSR